MVYINSWEEFSKNAENLYFADPMAVRSAMMFKSLELNQPLKLIAVLQFRIVTKYRAKDGLYLKVTNDRQVSPLTSLSSLPAGSFDNGRLISLKCYQFRTEYAQDVKKAEKLISQIMRHMASKEA